VFGSHVQVLVENMQYLDRGALDTDNCLLKELIHHRGFDGHLLGIVLISANDTCNMCAGELRVRADRPSFLTIYSDELGTTGSATYFQTHCFNHAKGCSFTQHYGFHMTGNESDIMYDTNCLSLPFFLSSHAILQDGTSVENWKPNSATNSQYRGVSLGRLVAAKDSLLRTKISLHTLLASSNMTQLSVLAEHMAMCWSCAYKGVKKN